MAHRILLVEDERQIREAITDYFTGREDGYELTCAGDGTEGLRKLQEKEYDLVLLDVMLPGMDGFTLMKTLRRDQEVPVIFLTARTREEDRLHGYELGCDDYVCKPFSLAELYAKTTALLKRAGGRVLQDTMKCGAICLERRTLAVTVNGREVVLAAKEYALLELLMEHPGWVYSREMLLDRIWGEDYFGGDRVVDNHVKKLRKALGNAGCQVKTVISKGYKLEER